MKHIIKTISIAVLISFICIFVYGKAQAKVLPKTAKLIPPETILLVDIDDFKQLKRQFEQTNLFKLYKDPAMASVIEDFKAKRHEQIQKMDNEFIKAIVDAGILPQGRAAFALVFDNQTKDVNELPILLISQWGENAAKIKETIDKMTTKAIENGAHRKTEDYRDVNITTIIQKSSETLYGQAINYCFIDDCLIGSVNVDVLKFVIAHIQGAASPTLSDEADYNTTIKAIEPYHDIDFYVNIKQIIKTAFVEETDGEAKTIVANLGLDNVTSLGGAIGIARGPGSSSTVKVFLKINGPKKGLMKMLDIESVAIKTPQFIMASTYSLTSINLDIKKAYDELYNILLRFSPQYAAITHTPLLPPSPQGEPGLQLKSDIIAHLGAQIVIAQSINKPISNSPDTETLLAVAINNRSALEKSFSLLYDKLIAPGNPEFKRELLGHTIYLAEPRAFMPALKPGQKIPLYSLRKTLHWKQPLHKHGLQTLQTSAKSDAPQAPKLAFTVTDTHLIFASEPAVERIIRTMSTSGTDSVTSSKWFIAAKSVLPSVIGIAGLQDNTASGELFWQMLKEQPKSADGGKKGSEIDLYVMISSKAPFPYSVLSQAGDLLDPSLLPAFDIVRKYFGLSAYYGISRPDGFFFEFNYFNPLGGS